MSKRLLKHFDLLAQAPDGVARLRELILTLAVQGKLVLQDPNDEPASVLLQSIRAEKNRLIAEGKIKRDKALVPIADHEKLFDLPKGWEWVRIPEISYNLGQCEPVVPFTYIDVAAIDNSRGAIAPEVQVVQPADAPSRARKIVEVGTVLYSTVRPYLKNIAVVEKDFQPKPIASTAFAVMQPHAGVKSQYLLHYLRSQPFTDFVNSKAVGVAYPAINDANFFQGVAPLPPTSEQSRIVARVEELMRLCDALEAKQRLETTQHAQLVQILLGTLTDSTTPDELGTAWQRVATHFDLLLDRPEAVDALEQTILQLAVRGLLVPQDPNDEPASVLLLRIRAEKDRLIAEGKIKRDKALPAITDEEKPFELPKGWEWARLNDLIRISSGDGLTSAQMTPGGTIPVFGGNGITGHHDKANVDEPTLVIGRVGYYCGSIHITPPKAWVTDNAFITRYPKALMDMRWLYWLLVGTDLKENDSATAQPVISGRKLYPIVVAVPPLGEQMRIVARVEELRQLCAELRQRLTICRTTQAYLAEALVESLGTS